MGRGGARAAKCISGIRGRGGEGVVRRKDVPRFFIMLPALNKMVKREKKASKA